MSNPLSLVSIYNIAFLLTVARNVLLYSLLIDDCKFETTRDFWSLFFDLYINSPTRQLIRQQSEKLVSLSASLQDWGNSPYGTHLRMVDSDTLNKLRHY